MAALNPTPPPLTIPATLEQLLSQLSPSGIKDAADGNIAMMACNKALQSNQPREAMEIFLEQVGGSKDSSGNRSFDPIRNNFVSADAAYDFVDKALAAWHPMSEDDIRQKDRLELFLRIQQGIWTRGSNLDRALVAFTKGEDKAIELNEPMQAANAAWQQIKVYTTQVELARYSSTPMDLNWAAKQFKLAEDAQRRLCTYLQEKPEDWLITVGAPASLSYLMFLKFDPSVESVYRTSVIIIDQALTRIAAESSEQAQTLEQQFCAEPVYYLLEIKLNVAELETDQIRRDRGLQEVLALGKGFAALNESLNRTGWDSLWCDIPMAAAAIRLGHHEQARRHRANAEQVIKGNPNPVAEARLERLWPTKVSEG